VRLYSHRSRHHFSHTWLERGGAEADLMELNGWVSPQMLTRYGARCTVRQATSTSDQVVETRQTFLRPPSALALSVDARYRRRP
jgi:hypothetical protein